MRNAHKIFYSFYNVTIEFMKLHYLEEKNALAPKRVDFFLIFKYADT